MDQPPYQKGGEVRLSDRDHAVIEAVTILGQITTGQIQRLCFSEPDTSEVSRAPRTRRALRRLVERGYLSRIERAVGGMYGGSEGLVYTGPTRRSQQIDLHALDIAEVYVRLIEAERLGLCRVKEFSPEEQVKGTVVKSDAYLWLEVAGRGLDWYLEIDRASEYKPQLKRKIQSYTRAARRADAFPRTMYVVTFAPRNRLAERASLIQEITRTQEFPEQFIVTQLDEVIRTLVAASIEG